MLTISLDEQGDFENMKNENAPIFIGGIIYNDRELENEHEYEKKRVSTYLQRVCMSVGAKYPRDLHFYKYANGGNNSNKVILFASLHLLFLIKPNNLISICKLITPPVINKRIIQIK